MDLKTLTKNPLHLAGLLALVGFFGIVGCKSSGDTSEGGECGACAGGACGGACGGSGEVGGDALKKKYPQWEKAKTLEGDAEAGKDYFYSEMFTSFMTCASCHGFDEGDTMTTDADGQIRAGYSVWGSAHRDKIKNRDDVAALGGNICVHTWMGGPEEGMSAQELANMQAFLESGGDADHATSENLDYANRAYSIPDELTGGDPERGEKLAYQYCQTCHDVGDREAMTGDVDEDLDGGVVPTKYLGSLAKRIKDPGRKHNDWMPGFPDDRMPEQDLLDLLAFFEKNE